MKKLVIAIAIIATAVTAKVGHSEYQEWSHEKWGYELHYKSYYDYDIKLESDYNQMKEYEEKMNDGFWRSIFNAFNK